MRELGCSYDSSFPDTDPFEPQSGGCCSILPYFFGDVVELPITLIQDHTMWEILRRDDIALWTDKATWVAERHGLVNVIVHPDYLEAIDGVRDQLGGVEHFVSLGSTGGRKGWTEYEPSVAASKPETASASRRRRAATSESRPSASNSSTGSSAGGATPASARARN